MSESDAAGRLISMPGMVDADATIPSKLSGVPTLVAKGFNTGFLDMVELRIAKKPMMQITPKKAFGAHCVLSMLNQEIAWDTNYFSVCFSFR